MEKIYEDAISKIDFEALLDLLYSDFEGYDSVYKSDIERPNLLTYPECKNDDEEIKEVVCLLAQRGEEASLYEQTKNNDSFLHISIGKKRGQDNQGRLYLSPNDSKLYPMVKDLIREAYRQKVPIYFKYTRENRKDKVVVYLKKLSEMNNVMNVFRELQKKHPDYFQNMDTPAIWINPTAVPGVYFSPEALVQHCNGNKFQSIGILMSYALEEIKTLIEFWCGIDGSLSINDMSKEYVFNVFKPIVIDTFFKYGIISPVINGDVYNKVYFPNEIGHPSNYVIEYDKERKVLTEGRRINNDTFRYFEIPYSRRYEYFTKPLGDIIDLCFYDEDYATHMFKRLYCRSDKQK